LLTSFRRRWFQIFFGGTALFFAAEQVLKHTSNPNLVPTVILLGAFVVPASFVAYFYGQERALDRAVHGEMPLPLVAASFLLGGAIGLIVAGILEYQTVKQADAWGLLSIGVIEEAAKLIFPIALFVHARYRSEVDGLLFGVACGMGFAALETMGYGLVAFMDSGGKIGAAEQTLLLRGLVSPAGHAAWTGLVCAVLWRQRQIGQPFSLPVLGAFALAVFLHLLWNFAASAGNAWVTAVGVVAVGGASLTLLVRRLTEARRLPWGPNTTNTK